MAVLRIHQQTITTVYCYVLGDLRRFLYFVLPRLKVGVHIWLDCKLLIQAMGYVELREYVLFQMFLLRLCFDIHEINVYIYTHLLYPTVVG